MDNNNQPTVTDIVFEAILDNHAVKKAGKVQKIDASMLLDDLKVDSLEKLALAMDFEEQFSIDISDEEIEAFLTVGDFVSYLEKAVTEVKNNSQQPAAQDNTAESVNNLSADSEEGSSSSSTEKQPQLNAES
jgi:acyl carrier protein|tara:strand:- start:4183 stop:4578 length:396 start_codon:yes stop_codon:yes gene_type:complete